MLLASTIFALTNIVSAFDFTWPFTTQRFKGNALLEAGTLGLASDVRVIAFGDFNGDQLYVFTMLNTAASSEHGLIAYYEAWMFWRLERTSKR